MKIWSVSWLGNLDGMCSFLKIIHINVTCNFDCSHGGGWKLYPIIAMVGGGGGCTVNGISCNFFGNLYTKRAMMIGVFWPNVKGHGRWIFILAGQHPDGKVSLTLQLFVCSHVPCLEPLITDLSLSIFVLQLCLNWVKNMVF